MGGIFALSLGAHTPSFTERRAGTEVCVCVYEIGPGVLGMTWPVSVSLGCCNRAPQTGGLNSRHVVLSSGAWKPKIKRLAWLGSGEGPLLAVTSHGGEQRGVGREGVEREEASSSTSFLLTLIPFLRGPTS